MPLAGVGGYVWQLVVTTESAESLGDGWGYPKVVGDVAIEESDGRRRTTVTVEVERVATLGVARPRTVSGSATSRSYTHVDGELHREQTHVFGRIGGGRSAAGPPAPPATTRWVAASPTPMSGTGRCHGSSSTARSRSARPNQ